jgi:hypothetical protein
MIYLFFILSVAALIAHYEFRKRVPNTIADDEVWKQPTQSKIDRFRSTFPACDPPNDTEPNRIYVGDNPYPYDKTEISPGKWMWVASKDEEVVMQAEKTRAYQLRRKELWFALNTRVLTDQEYAECRDYDRNLNMDDVVYNREEKEKQLLEGFYRQGILRLTAKDT